MLSGGQQLHHGLDVGHNGGHIDRVVHGVLGALFQRALQHLAAVSLDAGNGHLQAVQLTRHLHLDFRSVLVRRELGDDVHWLRLVDHAEVSLTAVHGHRGDLLLSCKREVKG